MKGFNIIIKNNLLEYKHFEKIGISVWLFIWLVDKTTYTNENGIGKVLGGKPIVYEDFHKDINIDPRTYGRWIKNLKNGGYINTLRTPNGLVITVNKSVKKPVDKKNRYDKNVRRIGQNSPNNKTKMSYAIKTIQGQYKDRGITSISKIIKKRLSDGREIVLSK